MSINTKNRHRLITIAKIAILSALASVIMLLEFPLLFVAPGYYKFDFSELVVMVGGFSMGPVAAVIIELVKNLLNLLFNGTVTGGVGELGNFIVGCSFTVTASLIYKFHKSKKGAIVSLLSGTLALALLGIVFNYFVLIPAYAAAFHAPIESLTVFKDAPLSLFNFVIICVLPFNLIKGTVISILTFLIYKRISPILHFEFDGKPIYKKKPKDSENN